MMIPEWKIFCGLLILCKNFLLMTEQDRVVWVGHIDVVNLLLAK